MAWKRQQEADRAAAAQQGGGSAVATGAGVLAGVLALGTLGLGIYQSLIRQGVPSQAAQQQAAQAERDLRAAGVQPGASVTVQATGPQAPSAAAAAPQATAPQPAGAPARARRPDFQQVGALTLRPGAPFELRGTAERLQAPAFGTSYRPGSPEVVRSDTPEPRGRVNLYANPVYGPELDAKMAANDVQGVTDVLIRMAEDGELSSAVRNEAVKAADALRMQSENKRYVAYLDKDEVKRGGLKGARQEKEKEITRYMGELATEGGVMPSSVSIRGQGKEFVYDVVPSSKGMRLALRTGWKGGGDVGEIGSESARPQPQKTRRTGTRAFNDLFSQVGGDYWDEAAVLEALRSNALRQEGGVLKGLIPPRVIEQIEQRARTLRPARAGESGRAVGLKRAMVELLPADLLRQVLPSADSDDELANRSPERERLALADELYNSWSKEGRAFRAKPLEERLMASPLRPARLVDMAAPEGAWQTPRDVPLLIEGERNGMQSEPPPESRGKATGRYEPVTGSAQAVRTFGDLPPDVRAASYVRLPDTQALQNRYVPASQLSDETPLPGELYEKPLPDISAIIAERSAIDKSDPGSRVRLQQLSALEDEYFRLRQPRYITKGGELLEYVTPSAPYRGKTQSDLRAEQRSENFDYSNDNVEQDPYILAEPGQSAIERARRDFVKAVQSVMGLGVDGDFIRRALAAISQKHGIGTDSLKASLKLRIQHDTDTGHLNLLPARGRARSEKPWEGYRRSDPANRGTRALLGTRVDSEYRPFEEGQEDRIGEAVTRLPVLDAAGLRSGALSPDPDVRRQVVETFVAQSPTMQKLVRTQMGDLSPGERLDVVAEAIAAGVDDFPKVVAAAAASDRPWAQQAAAAVYASGQQGRIELEDFLRNYVPDYALGRLLEIEGGRGSEMPVLRVSADRTQELFARTAKAGDRMGLQSLLNANIRGSQTPLGAIWKLRGTWGDVADAQYATGGRDLGATGNTNLTNASLLQIAARELAGPDTNIGRLRDRFTQPVRIGFASGISEAGGVGGRTSTQAQNALLRERLSKPVRITGPDGKQSVVSMAEVIRQNKLLDGRQEELRSRARGGRATPEQLKAIDQERARIGQLQALIRSQAPGMAALAAELNVDAAPGTRRMDLAEMAGALQAGGGLVQTDEEGRRRLRRGSRRAAGEVDQLASQAAAAQQRVAELEGQLEALAQQPGTGALQIAARRDLEAARQEASTRAAQLGQMGRAVRSDAGQFVIDLDERGVPSVMLSGRPWTPTLSGDAALEGGRRDDPGMGLEAFPLEQRRDGEPLTAAEAFEVEQVAAPLVSGGYTGSKGALQTVRQYRASVEDGTSPEVEEGVRRLRTRQGAPDPDVVRAVEDFAAQYPGAVTTAPEPLTPNPQRLSQLRMQNALNLVRQSQQDRARDAESIVRAADAGRWADARFGGGFPADPADESLPPAEYVPPSDSVVRRMAERRFRQPGGSWRDPQQVIAEERSAAPAPALRRRRGGVV